MRSGLLGSQDKILTHLTVSATQLVEREGSSFRQVGALFRQVGDLRSASDTFNKVPVPPPLRPLHLLRRRPTHAILCILPSRYSPGGFSALLTRRPRGVIILLKRTHFLGLVFSQNTSYFPDNYYSTDTPSPLKVWVYFDLGGLFL